MSPCHKLGACAQVALGGRKGGQVAFVSLFSVANAAGRLLFGHASEHFMHAERPLPRTLFLALASALSTACTACLAASPTLHSLYAISMLSGFAFGGAREPHGPHAARFSASTIPAQLPRAPPRTCKLHPHPTYHASSSAACCSAALPCHACSSALP